MYSAYQLNKQGDNIQPLMYSYPNFEPLHCSMSSSASWPAKRFLRRQVKWSGIPISFRIFHSNTIINGKLVSLAINRRQTTKSTPGGANVTNFPLTQGPCPRASSLLLLRPLSVAQTSASVCCSKVDPGTSLVVQGIRIRLPMQGTWVRSLVEEQRPYLPRDNSVLLDTSKSLQAAMKVQCSQNPV